MPRNMRGFRRLRWALLPTLLAALIGLSLESSVTGQEAPASEPPALTRGPIHEAFAEPINFNPKPGPLIPRQPPANIEEIPPDQKPDGDNVGWIPGYWHWDDEKNEFLWVSGFWRVIPPGRQWIPGYWNQVENRWQWVSGYWASQEQKEAVYLPEPPASLENGPVTPQPSNDQIWVPGTWVYRETRYMWQPGYWVVAAPGWIWTPATYVWTPCGYVFVDGYWDYSIRRRGCLFAPFYYDVVFVRPGWVYRPMICIDIDVVTAHFWCRPSFCHYYFGDYYGPTYVSLGFTPWFNYTYVRGGYCPIYHYHAWYFRTRNPGWDAGLRADFQFRFNHVDARPPRTFVQQQMIVNNFINVNNTTIVNNTVNNFNRTNVQTLALAKPMNQLVTRANADADAPIRFQRINQAQLRETVEQQQQLRRAHQQRVEIERATAAKLIGSVPNGVPAATAPAGGPRPTPRFAAPTRPVTAELPKTPIVAKPMPTVSAGAAGAGGTGTGPAGQPVTGRPSRLPPPVPKPAAGIPGGPPSPAVGSAPAPSPTQPIPFPGNGGATGGSAARPRPSAPVGTEPARPRPGPQVPTDATRPVITKPAPVPNPGGGVATVPASPGPRPQPQPPRPTIAGGGPSGGAAPTIPAVPSPRPQPPRPTISGGSSGGGAPAVNPPTPAPRPPAPAPKPPTGGGSSGGGAPAVNPPTPRPQINPPPPPPPRVNPPPPPPKSPPPPPRVNPPPPPPKSPPPPPRNPPPPPPKNPPPKSDGKT